VMQQQLRDILDKLSFVACEFKRSNIRKVSRKDVCDWCDNYTRVTHRCAGCALVFCDESCMHQYHDRHCNDDSDSD
jgi:hypothetical protein